MKTSNSKKGDHYVPDLNLLWQIFLVNTSVKITFVKIAFIMIFYLMFIWLLSKFKQFRKKIKCNFSLCLASFKLYNISNHSCYQILKKSFLRRERAFNGVCCVHIHFYGMIMALCTKWGCYKFSQSSKAYQKLVFFFSMTFFLSMRQM